MRHKSRLQRWKRWGRRYFQIDISHRTTLLPLNSFIHITPVKIEWFFIVPFLHLIIFGSQRLSLDLHLFTECKCSPMNRIGHIPLVSSKLSSGGELQHGCLPWGLQPWSRGQTSPLYSHNRQYFRKNFILKVTRSSTNGSLLTINVSIIISSFLEV